MNVFKKIYSNNIFDFFFWS